MGPITIGGNSAQVSPHLEAVMANARYLQLVVDSVTLVLHNSAISRISP
jgi:hypothetical protein